MISGSVELGTSS